ncbi:MAG: DUF4321 domain-containing protein [candidate division NC10 bacterium]
MAGAQRGVGLIVLILLVGAVIGSFLGALAGTLLSEGWLQSLLTRGPPVGLKTPATLDLQFLTVSLGLALKVNLAALLGLIFAALILRRL